ncbi:MAG TPA: ThiF family adenylyltransferase, partial [Candidatus Limnocylindria bacterium]|nr:ThiF family adenylyltransferase [Candidatus Limnocylindria bacterium]
MTDSPARVRQVDIPEALRLAEAGYRVVDVREPFEWQAGHVAGALHVPLGELQARFEAEVPDRSTPLLLYCRSGARSGRAADYLAQRGYSGVVNLAALIEGWPRQGGAWEAPGQALTPAQQRRYGRQLLLPEIGPDGQRRLLDSKVLVLGAGGLGSPVALYLGAAGVGTIGLVDDDSVDESNLQRQVLHGVDRIGQPKTASARTTLNGLNPDTNVVEHGERLTQENAERLIGGYGLVVDGSDNLETRYALNDAAVRLRKTVVHASAYRWEAQVTTLVP